MSEWHLARRDPDGAAKPRHVGTLAFFNIYLPPGGALIYNLGMTTNLIVKALLLGFSALALVGQAQQNVKMVPVKPTASVTGKDLFRQYCAVCHGTDGKGAGPAAAAMKSRPTDLTQISRDNHGKFPEDKMMRLLQGQDSVTAHGTEDMPVWGTAFNNMSPNLELTQTRLHALVQYLEDLQAK